MFICQVHFEVHLSHSQVFLRLDLFSPADALIHYFGQLAHSFTFYIHDGPHSEDESFPEGL